MSENPNEQIEEQYIAFIDASGNFDQKDRFFGVGMLMLKNPGPITDKLHLIYQRIMAISQTNRDQAIDNLIRQGKQNEVIKMLKKSKRFELKYDRITPVKFSLYKDMINVFSSYCECRFSCMVINRHSTGYDDNFFKTMWDAYTSYVATLITNEGANIPNANLFLVLDEVPKPKKAPHSLEETILLKINKRIDNKYQDKQLCRIVSAVRIESHSNLLMQLTDVLLGSVMYDFKKKAGILSAKLQNKKDEVILELRNRLNRDTLAEPFTCTNQFILMFGRQNGQNKNGESDKKPHPHF